MHPVELSARVAFDKTGGASMSARTPSASTAARSSAARAGAPKSKLKDLDAEAWVDIDDLPNGYAGELRGPGGPEHLDRVIDGPEEASTATGPLPHCSRATS
jgi:hypothetical protein